MAVKVLMSWADLSEETFGGGHREALLRRSIAEKITQVLHFCEQTSTSVHNLKDDVSVAIQENEITMLRSTQVHASMAALGANVFNPNVGRLGIENLLRANQGVRMMEAAVAGQKARERANVFELGDAIDRLFVPSHFTPDYALLVEDARKLRIAHQKVDDDQQEL